MAKKKKIVINHIAKTEGHSSFEGALYDGRIKEARYFSEEGARLIEGILLGRYFEDAPIITSRICGVCPVVHSLASIKALEAALEIKVAPAVNTARRVMMLGEVISSHLFHNYFFSLPDLLGHVNDFEMMKLYPKQTKAAMTIRVFGASLINLFGGRSVHPIAGEVGGFKVWPKAEEIKKVLELQKEARAAIDIILPMYTKVEYPQFERETEYICLSNKGEYAIYDGDMVSTKGLKVTAKKFSQDVKEIQRQREVVKHTSFRGMAYFVGALARINNNYQALEPEAREVWRDAFSFWKNLKGEKIITNPFMNIYAQTVEILNFIIVSKSLLNQMLAARPPKNAKVKVKAGAGVGAVEAPRGTLLHYYKLDKQGKIVAGNVITPTAQFLSNIEEDIMYYGPELARMGDKQRKQRIRTLIRAYDPCISCATH